MFPQKLKTGDEARVVATSETLAAPWISKELKEIAISRFKEFGLKLSFGKHVSEIDEFNSTSIESRVSDLHNAFSDENVKLIIAVTGGNNANQLLKHLDYHLIKNNPKIFCGYSDVNVLANAIYAKTGMITYSGPQFTSFGNRKDFDYSLEYFKKCLFFKEPFTLKLSEKWSDDDWDINQEKRKYFKNEGYWIINEGVAEGIILGGNQCTFNLLHGTEFMPSLKDSLLFLEDDFEVNASTFDRDLYSIILQPGFEKVKGIAIGRFQKKSGITKDILSQIIKTKKELNNIPIIGNVDFGHTTPMITFPIGGVGEIEIKGGDSKISIIKH
ncbi:MAG: S66 peptidase family protein [Minisyncoccia bacterium]